MSFDLIIIWYAQALEDAHLPADCDTVPFLRGTGRVITGDRLLGARGKRSSNTGDSSSGDRSASVVNSSGGGRSVSVADGSGGGRSVSVADSSGGGGSASVVDSSDGCSTSTDGSGRELLAGDRCARVFGDWGIREILCRPATIFVLGAPDANGGRRADEAVSARRG